MSVHDMAREHMPSTDIAEVAYRIKEVSNRLGEVCDDWTRQEMYDCIGYQTSVLEELYDDLNKIARVMDQIRG